MEDFISLVNKMIRFTAAILNSAIILIHNGKRKITGWSFLFTKRSLLTSCKFEINGEQEIPCWFWRPDLQPLKMPHYPFQHAILWSLENNRFLSAIRNKNQYSPERCE